MIKKIETIENEFVEQLRELLYDSFSSKLDFRIEYYIGEDYKGIRGLYIEIRSKMFGLLYLRSKTMEDYELVTDIEEKFLNSFINDLVLAGMSFLNIEALNQRHVKDITSLVTAKEFKRLIPNLTISLN